ncbi:MAG TPA: hypothetical protein VIM70_08200 [Clostridium sp.]|uniref:hypothetical protein n=1 Tax=Clostridium sp. TaxID=1506 RepID=UPI002F93C473
MKISEDMLNFPEKYIPIGLYCHGRMKPQMEICPFWDNDETKHKQENGYCHYLKQGDWDLGYTGLLWDMYKECDIKLDD